MADFSMRNAGFDIQNQDQHGNNEPYQGRNVIIANKDSVTSKTLRQEDGIAETPLHKQPTADQIMTADSSNIVNGEHGTQDFIKSPRISDTRNDCATEMSPALGPSHFQIEHHNLQRAMQNLEGTGINPSSWTGSHDNSSSRPLMVRPGFWADIEGYLKYRSMLERNHLECDIGSDANGSSRTWHDAFEQPPPSRGDITVNVEQSHVSSPASPCQTEEGFGGPVDKRFANLNDSHRRDGPSRYDSTPFSDGYDVSRTIHGRQNLSLMRDQQRPGPNPPGHFPINQSIPEWSGEFAQASLNKAGSHPMTTTGYQFSQGNNSPRGLLQQLCRNQEPSAQSGPSKYFVHDNVDMRNPIARVPYSQNMALETWESQFNARNPAMRPQALDEHGCVDISDDDEPLITRTTRHRPVLSDSYLDRYSPTTPVLGSCSDCWSPTAPVLSPCSDRWSPTTPGPDSHPGRYLPTTPIMNPSGGVGIESGHLQQADHPSRSARSMSASSDETINFALPKYDAQFEPAKSKHDPVVAKISLPGLVREEILLSPDHADQETHLFLNIFLPAQKSLAIPDPHPAQAVLNFHTIAVMVIEAFVQFEIGDELGTGRGHWHQDHDQGMAEYERVRDAQDADPDEIFFAVIDRWRAGMESRKQPSQLVRGAQEFCDVALDLIYYIKEHGFVTERKRAQRSDKGVKRGPRLAGKEEGLRHEKAKSGKRAVAKEAHEVPAKKKAKTGKAKAETTKNKAVKRKRPELKVTVVRKGGT